MAGKGPAPKPDRQRRNERAELVVHPGGRLDQPEPRSRWSQIVVEQWDDFWGSVQALAVTKAELPTLYRLFDLRQQAADLQAAVDEWGPLIDGSTGSKVLNPASRQFTSVSAEIRHLEGLFGLTPGGKLSLGLKVADAKSELESFNEKLRLEKERRLADGGSET